MAGITTTDALQDSSPTVISSARIVREQRGGFPRLCDVRTLGNGIGPDWNEVSLNQLTARNVSEDELLDDPQQLTDSLITITPQVSAIQTLITDKVAARISANAFARTGGLGQNAIQRKKDEDGVGLASTATTDLGTSTAALATADIVAAAVRIRSNPTDPAPDTDPIYCVHHGYALLDIWNEIVLTPLSGANAANAASTAGMLNQSTMPIYNSGIVGTVHSAIMVENGNITIDATPDAVGLAFARSGVVLVQGRSPRIEMERVQIGGGATAMFHYDEYAYGERGAGLWMYGLTNDATAPT